MAGLVNPRLLKFRGWHTGKKKMFTASEMGADQLTLSVDGRGFVNVNGDHTHLSTFYPIDKFIPLQFTGQWDRNKREIYEGDICRIHDFDIEIVEIVYRSAVAGFEGLSTDDGTFKNRHVELRGDYYEVIGNIYETPELLTGGGMRPWQKTTA